MKNIKLTILLLVVSVLLFSCNSKKEIVLNNKISELTESNTNYQNKISYLQKRITELENIITIFESNVYDEPIYENHEINYNLKFEYGGYNTKVYDAPNFNNEIYTIQKGDEIFVSNIIRNKVKDQTFIKVELITNDKMEGFIYLGVNPYRNGEFEPKETLVVDGMEVQTLKMESQFELLEGIKIKELPSENSKTIYEITFENQKEFWKKDIYFFKSFEITSDYKWVKVQVEDYVGWIHRESCSVSRGGPTIRTPEATINWELCSKYEI